MSKDEPSPGRLGSLIKRVFGLSISEETTTHKLGKSPVSASAVLLKDPQVKEAIVSVRAHEDIHDVEA